MELSPNLQYFIERFSLAKDFFIDSRGRIRSMWAGKPICPINRLLQGGGDPSNWGDTLGYSGKDILILMFAADNVKFEDFQEEISYVRTRFEESINLPNVRRPSIQDVGLSGDIGIPKDGSDFWSDLLGGESSGDSTKSTEG